MCAGAQQNKDELAEGSLQQCRRMHHQVSEIGVDSEPFSQRRVCMHDFVDGKLGALQQLC